MAISPPSDILIDAARAADPAKVQAATQRLAALASDPSAPNTGFSDALARAKDGATVAPTPGSAAAGPSAPSTFRSAATTGQGKTGAYTKFEAVLLQSFVESMLPKDDELYGDKNSAGVYRSMMAEQFANQIATSGGIGLAKAIEAAHPARPRQTGSGQG